MLNHQNLYDINIHSETFFCGLLNVIFGYNLENINDSEKNFPSIDLEDKLNRVAIQVTTQEAKFTTQIIEDIDILAVSNPQSKVIVSSRPLFSISESGKTFKILSLTNQERNVLYDSIVGDSSSNFAFHNLDPQMNSLLSRPFFCIIYALFKSEPKSWAKTDMDLVSAFIKRTLQKVENRSSVLTDLSAIAAN